MADAISMASTQEGEHEPWRSKYRILFVEDDLEWVRAVRDNLASRGLTNLTVTSNAREATQSLAGRFDAVVADVRLSDSFTTGAASKQGDEWLLEQAHRLEGSFCAIVTAYPRLIRDLTRLDKLNVRVVPKGSDDVLELFDELERRADLTLKGATPFEASLDATSASPDRISSDTAANDHSARNDHSSQPEADARAAAEESMPLDSNKTTPRIVIPCVIDSTPALAEYLLREPSFMYELPSRRFEELIAELVKQFGWRVHLTPAARDGGRDIIAILPTDIGSLLCLIETKRYRMDRPIGVGLVRQLWGTVNHDDATLGMLVTSSKFSREARHFQGQHQFRLQLKDHEDVFGWLRRYCRKRG